MPIIKIVRKKQKQKGQNTPDHHILHHEPAVGISPISENASAKAKDIGIMQGIEKNFRLRLQGASIGLFICIGLGMMASKSLNLDLTPRAAPASVYFELKVLSEDGRPVAGAKVLHKKRRIGTTDSFGEWRRFIKVDPGANIDIHVMKNVGEQIISANKNFLVPLDIAEKKDLKLGTSIILDFKDQRKESLLTQAQVVNDPSPQNNEEQITNLSVTSHPLQKITFAIEPSEKEKAAMFLTHLIPALSNLATASGLKVEADANWRASLKHLSSALDKKDYPGVLQITANLSNQSPVVFLSNYTGNATKTAENILQNLKYHFAQEYIVQKSNQGFFVRQIDYAGPFWDLEPAKRLRSASNKIFTIFGLFRQGNHRLFKVAEPDNSPCLDQNIESCRLYSLTLPQFSPDKEFVPFAIHLPNVKSDAKVFAHGFLATKGKNDMWHYWGKEGSGTYLTVVVGNQVVFRELVNPQPEQLTVARKS